MCVCAVLSYYVACVYLIYDVYRQSRVLQDVDVLQAVVPIRARCVRNLSARKSKQINKRRDSKILKKTSRKHKTEQKNKLENYYEHSLGALASNEH